MQFRILVNDNVKKLLLEMEADSRRQMQKACEYLENGLWEGGLRIKKLHGATGKTVLEARLNRGDRLLFTLGRGHGESADAYLYLWNVVAHDDVSRGARNISAEDAPFLSFQPYETHDLSDVDLSELGGSLFTQERIEERVAADSGGQRWFPVDEGEWERILLYSQDEFEIFLLLTDEQHSLLQKNPPLLLSGTAGSGKTTLCIYYLLRPSLCQAPRIFLTYNRHLRNFCERLYRGLLNCHPDSANIRTPDFRTFKEFCLSITPHAEQRFPADREVNAVSFQELFRKHRMSGKYDAMLVWEEIRSIIKGAKPQIRAEQIRDALLHWNQLSEEDVILLQLREEILALRSFSVREKVESVFQRLLGYGIVSCAQKLPELFRTTPGLLRRAFETVASVMEKHETDFNASLMTLAEYELLGRKRAPLFAHNRGDIYSIAEWYQSCLAAERFWDEIDLTRAAIRAIDEGKAQLPEYEFVCCDEVQDLTDIQLSLLIRIGRRPEAMLLAGDPKQIINPSGFRWEEVKALFYDRGIPAPAVHHLTLNFRSSGSIVALSNTLLKLKQQWLGVSSDEHMDEWKFQGRPPFLLEGVGPEEMIESIRSTGADRMILTRTQQERDHLKQELGTELVFTIEEAKGLEFRGVLLWKFCEADRSKEVWTSVINGAGSIHEAFVRHEINLLYTGITRAQKNLIIYDGVSVSVIWSDPALADCIFRTPSLALVGDAWNVASTPREWEKQGDYFLEHEHYKAAAECFRNADKTDRMNFARALYYEKIQDWKNAALSWEGLGEYEKAGDLYERAKEFAAAMEIWESLENPRRAALCRIHVLELQRSYSEAAELAEEWEQWDIARDLWRRAHRPERLAAIYERQKKYAEAAQCYESASRWQQAAVLYLRIKDTLRAAQCYESATLYREAANLWLSKKRSIDAERCLLKTQDALLVAEFYEGNREWKKALEFYSKAAGIGWNDRTTTLGARRLQGLPPEIERLFRDELQKLGTAPRFAAKRALRLQILGSLSEAAAEWTTAKVHDVAAELYLQSGDFASAGAQYIKARRWESAALALVRVECTDESLKQLLVVVGRWIRETREPHKEVEHFADALRSEQLYLPASRIYTRLGLTGKAAETLAAAGNIEEAIHLYQGIAEYDKITALLVANQRFEQGLKVYQWLSNNSPNDRHLGKAFADFLQAWKEGDSSPATTARIADVVKSSVHRFTLQFVLDVMKDVRDFDTVYEYSLQLERVFGSMPSADRKNWILAANAKEREGLFGEAAACFLIGHEMEKAERCLRKLSAHPGIAQCLAACGMGELAIQALKDAGEFDRAGWLALDMNDPDVALGCFRHSKNPAFGGDALAERRHYKQALVLYKQAGDAHSESLVLEKLKRYSDAAKAANKAGEVARAQKLLAKTAQRKLKF